MIHDRNSAQADGQRKAFKFTVYVFVFCVVFAAAAGLISSMPKRINSSAAQKLFSNRGTDGVQRRSGRQNPLHGIRARQRMELAVQGESVRHRPDLP